MSKILPFKKPGSGNGDGQGKGPEPTADADIIRQNTWKIINNKTWTHDNRVRALFNFICTQEVQKDGSKILYTTDGACRLLSGLTRKLHMISTKDHEFMAHLFFRYNLLERSKITQDVVFALRSFCVKRGAERDLRRFVFYCKETERVYISRYDGTCFVLDGSRCKIVLNGSGPNLFVDDDGGVGCSDPLIGPHGLLFPTLLDKVNYSSKCSITAKEQRFMLAVWLFALAFPDLLPTKPQLLVEGQKGSGKTSVPKFIARVIHGKDKPNQISAKSEKDFPIILLRSPICILDDVNSYIGWMQDSLTAYATNGQWTKRRLYTDDGEIIIKPHAFVAVTSNNPVTFHRDDLVDRLILLRVERRDTFTSEETINAQIDENRNQLFGEWLYYVNKIIAEIRKGVFREHATSTHRLADFAAFSYCVGAALGVKKDFITDILKKMERERILFLAESNVLIDLLDRWLSDGNNVNRTVSLTDLFKELSMLAFTTGQRFVTSPTALASSLEGSVIQNFYAVTIVGKKQNSTGMYIIKRKETVG